MTKPKLIRITTVPSSLKTLLKGQHRFMSSRFEVLGVASAGQDLQTVEKEENIRVVPIEMTRTLSPFKDLISLWLLYKLFKKERPSIVHTHTPKAGTLGMIASKLANIPVRMHTIAGLPLLEAKGPKRTLLDIVEKITYSCATKVYPNSFVMKDLIIQNKYCKPEKLRVIGNGSSNGINTDFFSRELITQNLIDELKAKFLILENDFVYIFIGRLVGDKGINELVKAFTLLNDKNAATKLLLVGSSEPMLDPLSADTIATIKTHPSIINAGYQTDVRPYLAVAQALVFPSYREGFPNVPMQAGAMELPCIVTDINGCNEIITHEHNGLIIPVKNTMAIMEAMERLITDKKLYNHLKANARNSIVSRYDQLSLWNLIKEEYDNQLKLAGIK